MNAIVTLLAAAIAILAHRRAPATGDPGPRLRAFALTALVAWALVVLGCWPALAAIRIPLLLAALVAGLAGWAMLMTLVAVGTRRSDLGSRIGWLAAAALMLALGTPAGATAFTIVLGTMAWRWKEPLATHRRFGYAVAALALASVLLWVRPVPQLGSEGMAGFARVVRRLALVFVLVPGGYALFGSLALLRAWVSDPSLGIRAVNRRLAFSHVLVGLVPLLLLGGLWATTTYLGVLNERAIVGAQVLAEQGRWYEHQLAGALAHPAGAPARLASLGATPEAGGQRTRVWWRHDGRLTRVAGDSTADESHLGAWLDSLDAPPRWRISRRPGGRRILDHPPIPASGVLRLGDSLFLAAAVRAPADSSEGAILAAPLGPRLAALGDSVARARLAVWRQALVQQGAASFGTEDVPDSAAIRDLTRSISGPTRRDTGRTARRGLRTAITAAGDTFNTTGTGGAFLFEGHALTPGLHWSASGWRRSRYMMTASADAGQVLSGLIRDTGTNALGVIPLLVVGFFTLLALLVLWWDLAMVTGMGRSIADAVGALRGAATRFAAGDLTHRIALAGDDDLWQVAGAFNQAAGQLERAREAERDRVRLENELDVARRIQSRLLPSEPPAVEGLEVAGRYEPAREVGGDYYDHLVLDAHRVLLVIADVSGKSVPAALIMSGFRAALVSQDLVSADLPPLAERLGEFLHASLDPGKFVTAFLAVIDGRDGAITYVNAGHNPPVRLRADGGHELLETGGTILGILPHTRYERGTSTLAPGDLLVLYTDGVTEAARLDGEQWGEERLVETLIATRTRSCAEIAAGVAKTVRTFESDAGPTDDVTLVIARRV